MTPATALRAAMPREYEQADEFGHAYEVQGESASPFASQVPAPPAHPHADALHAELASWPAEAELPLEAREFRVGHPLDLAVHGWGDAPAGPGLRAAAKWLLLAGALDGHVERLRLTGRTDEARCVLRGLATAFPSDSGVDPGSDSTRPEGGGTPFVRAAQGLRADSTALAGPGWTARHDADFRAHLESSLDRLAATPAVPTVPQYLSRHDHDGAARCAADWTELAHGAVLPEQLHRHPQFTDLLARFAHLQYWMRDLAARGATAIPGGGSLLRAFEVHEGLSGADAAEKLTALCAAELTTFAFLAEGIARGSHWPPRARGHVRALVRFTHALAHWTADTPDRR
ncbi:terpene synthase family protein [Kitasatospora sp. NPDC088134]|uniref:terpene synthase family protein n=1 Tax=Kitasatospora sp. NPDC088134 TaxID=3364071 RepID=UPI00382A81C5